MFINSTMRKQITEQPYKRVALSNKTEQITRTCKYVKSHKHMFKKKWNTKECIYLLKFIYTFYTKFKIKHNSILLEVRRIDNFREKEKDYNRKGTKESLLGWWLPSLSWSEWWLHRVFTSQKFLYLYICFLYFFICVLHFNKNMKEKNVNGIFDSISLNYNIINF